MSVGGYVSATVQLGDVEAGLKAIERRVNALGPAFREIKAPMRADQRTHARHNVGPSGTWKRRSAATIAKMKLPSGRGLTRRPLGKLLTAIGYSADATGVRAESKIPWSNVQQEGGTVGRGSKLPARPFLWISRRLLDIAGDVITKAILAAYGGR